MVPSKKIDMKRYPLAWNESYARKGTQWRGMFDVSAYREFLDLTGNVLELGSGDGNTASALARHCGNLFCIDIARTSFSTYAMRDPAINKAVGDARQLPFRDGTFSAAISRHVLTHTIPGDDAAIMRETARVLSPGGMVLLEAFTPADMRSGKGQEIFPRTFLRDGGLVWRFFLGQELDSLVKGAGLSVRHFQIIERKVRHEGQIYPRESIVMMASKA